MDDRDLRQKSQAQFSFNHSLAGLDGLHFEDHIGEEPGAPEKALAQSPVARTTIVKNQRPRFNFLESSFAFACRRMLGMSHENQRIVAQGCGLHLGMIERARHPDIDFAVEDHL